jgi:hypothetical protein
MPLLAKWIQAGATALLICGCSSVTMGPPRGVPTRGSLPPNSQCPRDPGDKGSSPTVVEIVCHRGGT